MTDGINPDTLLELTADIVSAHISNNRLGAAELPDLIRDIHIALSGLAAPTSANDPVAPKPAVPIRSSIKQDHLVCLEDGKRLTMLKRYLMRTYGMTPADYRAKWKLPPDYPMVAPDYAEKRRVLANSIGLGRKRPTSDPVQPDAGATAKAARKPRARKTAG